MSKLLVEKADHILRLTLNRPEVKNALDPELLCGLADAFVAARDDDDVRVVILHGEGDVFCAGADLGKLIPLISKSREPENEFDARYVAEPNLGDKGLLRNFDVEKPVIAAINGHAIAGGMELVQGTDMRIAADTAKFGVQEVKWAIFPAGGSTVRLPQQLPFARAMELLLTGDLVTAEQAYEMGFLNRVVPKDKVLDEAYELAGKIARNGPLAVKAIRKSARACLGRPEAEAMDMERKFAAPVFASEDAKEGPRSFLEKRPPVYKGR
ncbi:MAG: enoyl-CoA hydratase-related protein [Pseudomonadota bacterium]|nr:enoyl-CoA hydratase-related protein [Pseudomonadota bacterium]